MPEDNPNLYEIMATTRSMRRLKPDLVPAPLIRKILKAGVSAPSAGNMQRWRFLYPRPQDQADHRGLLQAGLG
jgi:nicotinate-nucleotide--dimethylbenzimidazole phosphoribosyltransferase